MRHSLPLSSRSALGEERAFKNSTTDLNISALCLLQVISNYSADKRLLAQGNWHSRCHSRGLDTMVPSPSFSLGASKGLGERDQKIIPTHGPVPGHNSDMSSYLAESDFLEQFPLPPFVHIG